MLYQRNDGISGMRSAVVNKMFQMDSSALVGKWVLAQFNKYLMHKHKAVHAKQAAILPAIVSSPVLASGLYNGMCAIKYARQVEIDTTFGREVLGLRVDKLSRGMLSVRLPYKDLFVGNYLTPCLHGGVAAAVIDHCGGFCARTLLDDSKMRVSTVALHLDYLAPAGCFVDMYCDAKVISEENFMIEVDIRCWNECRSKQLVIARALFNIYTPKSSYS